MYQPYTCVEWVLMYLVPHKLGATNCPIKFRLSNGEIATIMDDISPEKNERHRFSRPLNTSPVLDKLLLSRSLFHLDDPSYFSFFSYLQFFGIPPFF
ncbi:hypothetical protein JWG42_00865 [Desulfoprunum benzoelyticum]|uniref:Uncharacterized protein n=1 Tax=Desulfoprunum benzoelyticum TaxID=1506996 RepID=A0A840USE2_9BACT|nr:hypothetical protein [Desulfoprunum benzoelyticum]MBB5346294.1 hypothetical protein [Desulfoprunum benzoelyticum]MBM9528705.1 hypothetical protein [Desulfoprunum benzoelyticum]